MVISDISDGLYVFFMTVVLLYLVLHKKGQTFKHQTKQFFIKMENNKLNLSQLNYLLYNQLTNQPANLILQPI